MVESTPKTKRLKVRSDTLSSLTPQASIVTTPGTADRMPVALIDTADTMPVAMPADQSPLSRGDRVVSSSSHYSWKALQDTGPSDGRMAGAGFGKDIGTEMAEPRHMPGAVPKNKAPF